MSLPVPGVSESPCVALGLYGKNSIVCVHCCGKETGMRTTESCDNKSRREESIGSRSWEAEMHEMTVCLE